MLHSLPGLIYDETQIEYGTLLPLLYCSLASKTCASISNTSLQLAQLTGNKNLSHLSN